VFINGERLNSEGHESELFELKNDEIVVRPFVCLVSFFFSSLSL